MVFAAAIISLRVLPFAGMWLLCGELSTLPLNTRWFLLNTGRGGTPLVAAVNWAFAASFFAVRGPLFWIGLAGFLRHSVRALEGAGVPAAAVGALAALLAAGALLNAYWFVRIVQMARRSSGRDSGHRARERFASGKVHG